MSENNKPNTVRAWKIDDSSRPLLQFIVPEPIPEDAARLLLSDQGYQMMTKEEWATWTAGRIMLPQFAMFTYNDIPLSN